jgi:hypothetical protein
MRRASLCEVGGRAFPVYRARCCRLRINSLFAYDDWPLKETKPGAVDEPFAVVDARTLHGRGAEGVCGKAEEDLGPRAQGALPAPLNARPAGPGRCDSRCRYRADCRRGHRRIALQAVLVAWFLGNSQDKKVSGFTPKAPWRTKAPVGTRTDDEIYREAARRWGRVASFDGARPASKSELASHLRYGLRYRALYYRVGHPSS